VNNLNCVPEVIFKTIIIDLSENHYSKKIYLNNPNCVPMALRNGSGTPGSEPLNFGPEIFIAAGRVDHASSTVVCAQTVLCHLENERSQPLLAESSAVPRRPGLLYCRLRLQ